MRIITGITDRLTNRLANRLQKKRASSSEIPYRKSSLGGLPFEQHYITVLAVAIGFMAADLVILANRAQMLPQSSPPAKKQIVNPPQRPARFDYEYIITRNIFNSDGIIPNPISLDPQKPKDDAPVLSQLPLQLVGTIVHINEARSIATIEFKSGNNKILPFAPNDNMEGLGVLLKVERKKAIFRNTNNNRLEYIEIKDANAISFGTKPKTADGIEQNGNEFTLQRVELNKMLDNLPEILQQARAVPNIVPGSGGKVDGFKVLDIAPGSVYEKIGIQRMDIIKGVNRQPVDSPARAMELYNELKNSGNISIEVERSGRTEVFNYKIQ